MLLPKDKIAIQIPIDLYKAIEQKIKSSRREFKSVDEYLEFILRKIVKEEKVERAYTPEEEEKIKERLKNLGYI